MVAIVLAEEGTYRITYYAVDMALNVEAASSIEVNIDKAVPVPVHDGPLVVDEGSSIERDGWAGSPVDGRFGDHHVHGDIVRSGGDLGEDLALEGDTDP